VTQDGGALRALYHPVILDHCRHPRNFRVPAGARRIRADNPLCGDQIDVYLVVEGDAVRDIAFDGVGCAVAKASASLMTQAMMGRDLAFGRRLLDAFGRLVDARGGAPGDPDLGELAVFADLREFPARHQCATLAWNALREAVRDSPVVSAA
jgi:nitrogen fixation NifU-like protein